MNVVAKMRIDYDVTLPRIAFNAYHRISHLDLKGGRKMNGCKICSGNDVYRSRYHGDSHRLCFS